MADIENGTAVTKGGDATIGEIPPSYDELHRSGSLSGSRFDSFFAQLPAPYKQYQRMFDKNLEHYDDMFNLTDNLLEMGFGVVTRTHRATILKQIREVRPSTMVDQRPATMSNVFGAPHAGLYVHGPNGVQPARIPAQHAIPGRYPQMDADGRRIYAMEIEHPISYHANDRRRSSVHRYATDDEPCPIYIFVCLTCFFSPLCGVVGLCAFAQSNNNPNSPAKAQAYKFLLISTFLSLILWLLIGYTREG